MRARAVKGAPEGDLDIFVHLQRLRRRKAKQRSKTRKKETDAAGAERKIR